jgi:hypothetical protein
MKNIKKLFGLVLLLAVTISCEAPDGIGSDVSFVTNAKDPSGVSALTTITQDNSGKVTFVPRGEGITRFEITFGDATTQIASVDAGASVNHTYTEGIYNAKIVGISITGKRIEATQVVNVSFRSPENLVVTIENDRAISKKVTVKATADFALFYDVYFGDVANEVPVQVNNGESVSHVYANAGTYTIKIVSKSGAIRTTNYQEDFVVTAILAPTTSAPTPPSRIAGDVVSIFSDAYTNIGVSEWNPGWGQSTVLTNATIGSNGMLKYSLLNYTGIVTDYGNATNLSAMQYVHFDYWTPDATSLGIKIVNTSIPSGPTKESQVDLSTITRMSWVSIDIPLSDFTTDRSAITQLVLASSGGTVFIDNLYFYKNPSVTMVLPIDFQSTSLTYDWIGFGNAGYGAIPTAVITNPDATGNNVSSKVLRINKTAGSQTWAGASQVLDARLNFSAGTKIKVAVWSPLANSPILLKLEDLSSPRDGNGNPTRFVEVQALTTTSNAWEILTFDLTTSSSFNSNISYDKIVLFPNFGASNSADLIYYFDEIKQSN